MFTILAFIIFELYTFKQWKVILVLIWAIQFPNPTKINNVLYLIVYGYPELQISISGSKLGLLLQLISYLDHFVSLPFHIKHLQIRTHEETIHTLQNASTIYYHMD